MEKINRNQFKTAIDFINQKIAGVPVSEDDYQWSFGILNQLFEATGQEPISPDHYPERRVDASASIQCYWFTKRVDSYFSSYLRDIDNAIFEDEYPIESARKRYRETTIEFLQNDIRNAEQIIENAKARIAELLKGH